MKELFRGIALPLLAVAVGGMTAALTTAPVAADPPHHFGYCIPDARCNLLDPMEDCRDPIFDTWCEISIGGDCTTWSSLECYFPPLD